MPEKLVMNHATRRRDHASIVALDFVAEMIGQILAKVVADL